MESQPVFTVTDGKHKGRTGVIVSKTDFYTILRTDDDTKIRCKSSFAKELSAKPPVLSNEYDVMIQQILMESMKEKEDYAKQCSTMIQKQNKEYEESLKHDMKKQEDSKKLEFEEVSLEEMRRVRLLKFAK